MIFMLIMSMINTKKNTNQLVFTLSFVSRSQKLLVQISLKCPQILSQHGQILSKTSELHKMRYNMKKITQVHIEKTYYFSRLVSDENVPT